MKRLDKSLARINALTLGRIAKGSFTSRKGKLHDGGGLFIFLRPGGGKPSTGSWVYRYQLAQRERCMGLGSVAQVSGPEAREMAREARAMVKRGEDPLHQRTQERRGQRARERAADLTFREFADRVLDAFDKSGRHKKTRASWRQVLKVHAYPAIGSKALADISRADMVEMLRPIWGTKPDAARKARARVEHVFDEAILVGATDKPNPARYADLKRALAPFTVSKPTNHHAALPWREVPALMAKLATSRNLSAAALRLTILSAARTREVLGARFNEFENGMWMVPAGRMKAKRAHRVPVSTGIAALVDELRARHDGPLLVPLSEMAMSMQLKSMNVAATVHGFRSTFRDWAAEHNFPREIAEAALAHVVGGVEGSYFRSDLFEARRALMQAWSDFCLTRKRPKK